MGNKPAKFGIFRHFEIEAKFMAGLFIASLLIALIAGFAGPQVMRFIEQDRCLDAGGAYNAKNRHCEMAKWPDRNS